MTFRAAITSVGTSAKRYDKNFQTGGGVVQNNRGYTFVAYRAEASGNPITGGVGSQSRAPRGVQAGFGGTGSIPPGGFSNTPQTGSGDYAKSQPSGGAQATTSPNSMTQAMKPLKSPNDAITQALLQKILNDRKEGEKAVTRNAQTKKVESIDQSKLDEKTKAEIDKLSKTFQKNAKELEKSINEFKDKFEKELKGSPEDKNLDGILDKVVEEGNSDKIKSKIDDGKGNKIENPDFNPQGFIDAADDLDNWIKDNPETAKKYGDDLTNLNNQVQAQKVISEKEIALAENNPTTLLKIAEASAEKAKEAASELNSALEGKEGDEVTKFKEQLNKTMEALNPDKSKSFDAKTAVDAIGELKKSYNNLPDEIKHESKVDELFQKTNHFSARKIEGEILATEEQPNSDEFNRNATEYVKGDNGLDATFNEYYTDEQREEIYKKAVGDDYQELKGNATPPETQETTTQPTDILAQTGTGLSVTNSNLSIGEEESDETETSDSVDQIIADLETPEESYEDIDPEIYDV